MAYLKGDKFKLTKDALDNYGAKYADKVFTVREWYGRYNKDPWSTGDTHGHPGYDGGAGGRLYGSELPFDLYAWEMERA